MVVIYFEMEWIWTGLGGTMIGRYLGGRYDVSMIRGYKGTSRVIRLNNSRLVSYFTYARCYHTHPDD